MPWVVTGRRAVEAQPAACVAVPHPLPPNEHQRLGGVDSGVGIAVTCRCPMATIGESTRQQARAIRNTQNMPLI